MLIINIYRAGRGKISYPPAASDDCLGIGVYGHRTLAACSVAILTTPARFKKKKQYLLSADAQTRPSRPSLLAEGVEAEVVAEIKETAKRIPTSPFYHDDMIT